MLHKVLQYITLANIRKAIEYCGGRRFILTLIAGAGTWVLTWYAKITPEIYRDVTLGTVGIYIAGNTFQKTRVPPPKSNE